MKWNTVMRPQVDAGLLLAARASQAIAVATLDAGMAAGKKSHVVPTELLQRLNSEIGTRLVGSPAVIVDDVYKLTQRLVELHREFAQRLMEVLEPAPETSTGSSDTGSGLVLPFPTQLAQPGRYDADSL